MNTYPRMKQFITMLVCFVTLFSIEVHGLTNPKREFRGAWIQCVNGQFQGLSREAMQQKLLTQLDALQRINTNVIMFQVRAEGDALYPSTLEPWSRYLSGTQGLPPNPYWDPLQWMVEQCHNRGMEIHAWINPYRAKTKGTTEFSVRHPYSLHPERFFKYGDLLIFNPALQENRDWICRVVHDILNRYDVDGIHMDDYFYPYPQAGTPIPDEAEYQKSGSGFANVADWRRDNVNKLIKELHDTVRAVKPWVKFGVSPFGIYHNYKEGDSIPGSRTRGSENYNMLYADVLKWVNEGWVDYNVPQLYWNIGFKIADYAELVHFWAKYAGNRPIVVGQDLTRSMNGRGIKDTTQSQLPEKWDLQRSTPGVVGSCLWYSAVVADNLGGCTDYLAQTYHKYPALQPKMPFIDKKDPKKVKGLKVMRMPDGPNLIWIPRTEKNLMDQATRYVVYRFAQGEKENLEDASHIWKITNQTCVKLPNKDGNAKFIYCVTALDRVQNESKAKKVKVKL